jgi:hypothetical protein
MQPDHGPRRRPFDRIQSSSATWRS